ncbi:hypothetical protein OY671_002063 [Metschnikowia pulcherrima]|nr:hypothetical protein OY671_002063 [Metschnikowia pulcherrima]
MFGVFGLLNLLIGSVYPIVASFKAYDSYSRLATKTGSTTFNVGGVSIPLGTILKKATNSDAEIEEDTMNYRLLSVQMWLIYWMVNAAVSAAEISSARLKSSQVMSFNDVQREWATFSGQGCGLIYFKYLRPFLDENVGLLSRVSLEPLLASVSGSFVLPLAQRIGVSSLFSKSATSSTSTYAGMFSDYTKMFRSVPGNVELGASIGDISEYDVVDKPVNSDENELRNRGLKSESADITSGVPTKSQSWFWST